MSHNQAQPSAPLGAHARQQAQLGQLAIFREAIMADPSRSPDRYQLGARPVLPVWYNRPHMIFLPLQKQAPATISVSVPVYTVTCTHTMAGSTDGTLEVTGPLKHSIPHPLVSNF